MRSALIFTALISGMAALAVTGCAPVVRSHGFVATDTSIQPIQPSIDTKETIEARWGTPSTVGVFEDTYYYISATREDFAYFRPLITQQDVTAIHFAEDGTVASVETYGLDDSNRINLADRETPTRGRKMGFLEQIFGSIGSVNPQQLPGRVDTLPESAGGPNPY